MVAKLHVQVCQFSLVIYHLNPRQTKVFDNHGNILRNGRLVHGNVIPMGIPCDGMGLHTFVFPMRLRNRMRVSECY